jgi:mannosidase alpha-like ER degradation enhancer 2
MIKYFFVNQPFLVIGGLLSAHLLSYRLYLNENEDNLVDANEHLDPEWPCNGPLLRMAVDIADRILPGFSILLINLLII